MARSPRAAGIAAALGLALVLTSGRPAGAQEDANLKREVDDLKTQVRDLKAQNQEMMRLMLDLQKRLAGGPPAPAPAGAPTPGGASPAAPGAIDNRDFDGSGNLDGAESGLPILETRIGYSVPFLVEKQNLDLGFWGHTSWEDTEVKIAGED